MIKTIKVEKRLRLDELIKYVWDNGIDNENYYSYLGNHVSVGVQTLLWTNSIIGKNDIFTVEVEEDITEDTKFETLLEINNAGELYHYKNTTISSMSGASSKYFHAIIDGKLQLIWEAE